MEYELRHTFNVYELKGDGRETVLFSTFNDAVIYAREKSYPDGHTISPKDVHKLKEKVVLYPYDKIVHNRLCRYVNNIAKHKVKYDLKFSPQSGYYLRIFGEGRDIGKTYEECVESINSIFSGAQCVIQDCFEFREHGDYCYKHALLNKECPFCCQKAGSVFWRFEIDEDYSWSCYDCMKYGDLEVYDVIEIYD